MRNEMALRPPERSVRTPPTKVQFTDGVGNRGYELDENLDRRVASWQ